MDLAAVATLDSSAVEPGTRRVPGVAVAAGWFVAGAAWGAFARVWMAFLAEDPEFSMSGTLSIVVAFAGVGLGQSFGWLGRRAGLRRRWLTPVRILGLVLSLGLFAGAGVIMLPPVVFATLAISRTDWRPWSRTVCAVLATPLILSVIVEIFNDSFGLVHDIVSIVWFALVYGVLVAAFTMTLGPQLDGWRLRDPSTWRG